jgi:undecaprenyl-phosphate 4-deoxy-4-formamido-L-arabinose transferase
MTTVPLRLLSVIGSMISLAGIGGGLLLLILRIIHGPEWAAEGVFTLFAILFVFIGAQFIGMGLLGEYIGRIYNDVRGRPTYCVQKVVGRIQSDVEYETSLMKGSSDDQRLSSEDRTQETRGQRTPRLESTS